MSQLRYTGEKLRFPKNIKRGKGKKATVETLHPYHPDPELVKAVNLAILIRRPLLLMGEPGCGKSILAKALAYELHHEEATKQSDEVIIKKDYDDYYYEWKIKSSSKAVDGLYEFDAIERLGKAQLLSQQKDLTEADFKGKLAAKEFVTRKDMGLAIEKSTTESNRAVLLIDEIDKADMDFPNDLLNELDKSEFTIRETGETVVSKTKPIVVITSNGEKPLPDAFLRRCVFHRIKPLDEDILKGIVRNRYYKEGSADETLIKEAVEQFVAIRKYLGDNEMSVGKNVSTSELLDWFEALKYYQFEKMKAAQSEDAQPDPALQSMIDQLEMLGSDIQSIPFQQVLFKNYNTLLHFEKLKSQK